MFLFHPSNPNKSQISCQRIDFIRQKLKPKSKNELKMCLSRNTKVLDSSSPKKCQVNACSMWSG